MLLEISFETFRKSIKYIELTTAVIGSIYYFKYKHTFLKYFLILLWYIAVNEFLAFFFRENYILRNNAILYNIYNFINFSFLLILFKNYIKNIKQKQWILSFIIIYIISICIDFLFIRNYLLEAQVIPFIIGGLFIITSILFYFLEILNTNKVLYVSKYLLFWISIGLLLYFVGKISTRIIRNYYWKEISFYEEILVAEFILSIVMNISFIIGFICSKKDKQY